MADPIENPLPFQEIAHPADLCVLATGFDLCDLFVNMTLGMFQLMRFSSQSGPATVHDIDIVAPGYESLLVDWLIEGIYLSETEQGSYTHVQIDSLTSERIVGTVRGFRDCPSQRQLKAATFSDLSISQREDGLYVAMVVFDV